MYLTYPIYTVYYVDILKFVLDIWTFSIIGVQITKAIFRSADWSFDIQNIFRRVSIWSMTAKAHEGGCKIFGVWEQLIFKNGEKVFAWAWYSYSLVGLAHRRFSHTRYSNVILIIFNIFRRCNLFELLPLPLSGDEERQMDHSRLQFLVTGYQQLHKAQILLPALENEVSKSISSISCHNTTEYYISSLFKCSQNPRFFAEHWLTLPKNGLTRGRLFKGGLALIQV